MPKHGLRFSIAVRFICATVRYPREDRTMDFIERIFGFSPDGGSGALEFLLFLVPIVGVALLGLRAKRRRRK